MTNVFVTSRCPVASARALDNKRLLRMCLEAYDALCGALANHRYGREPVPDADPMPYKPAPRNRTHNVIRWTGADGLHFRWVLEHARALQTEARWRSGKTTNCKMFDLCDSYCEAHADEIPTQYDTAGLDHGSRFDPVEFYGAFNWNEFRATYSYAHRGRLALPARVSLFNRYRLSLLHKWQWTDRRPSVWGARGAPWWACDEQSLAWLETTFGARVHDNLQLRPHVVRQSAGFQERLHARTTVPAAMGIATTEPLALTWATGGLSFSSAPASDLGRPAGSALFAGDGSPDGESAYRLVLARTWDTTLPPLVVCMLNPSTADAFKNDPTVTRVETVARRLHARGLVGGYVVVNFASLRATKPRAMLAHPDPIGPHNLDAIRATMRYVRQTWCVRPTVLCAWGGDVQLVDRDGNSTRQLMRVLRSHGARVVALALTQAGEPRHPLYLSGKLRLKPYGKPNARPTRRAQRRNDARPRQRQMLGVQSITH